MRRIATLAIFLGFLTPMLASAPAHAQASRTWVSGVGDDANPCSRTAPCKTFAGAISKTAVNGEINCLDPGGFGAVTITKSITIDCHEIFASINNAGVNGINIAGSGANVTIRNINIDGVTSGVKGISITTANNVSIEDCEIFGQTQQAIADTRTTGGSLTITNTTARNNGGAGVGMATTGGTLKLDINNFRSVNNNVGVDIATNANVSITNSMFVANVGAGIQNDGAAMTINGSQIANNATGVLNNAGVSRLSNNDIMLNTTGVNNAGGTVFTHGNNRIASIGSNTVGTITSAGGPTENLGQQ